MHHAAPPFCTPEDSVSDPQAHWDAAARRVETMRDALGKPIDAGIKHLVTALNASGFPTTASCEGHLGWGVPAPWVDIAPASTQRRDARRRELDALDEEIDSLCRDHPDNSPVLETLSGKRRALAVEVRRPTLVLARDLTARLAAFYRDRRVPYDQTISLHLRCIDFRVECHGTALQDLAAPEEKMTNLQRYQTEMRAFTAFLATSSRQRFGE